MGSFWCSLAACMILIPNDGIVTTLMTEIRGHWVRGPRRLLFTDDFLSPQALLGVFDSDGHWHIQPHRHHTRVIPRPEHHPSNTF